MVYGKIFGSFLKIREVFINLLICHCLKRKLKVSKLPDFRDFCSFRKRFIYLLCHSVVTEILAWEILSCIFRQCWRILPVWCLVDSCFYIHKLRDFSIAKIKESAKMCFRSVLSYVGDWKIIWKSLTIESKTENEIYLMFIIFLLVKALSLVVFTENSESLFLFMNFCMASYSGRQSCSAS